MAVLWITEISNYAGWFALNQSDTNWQPELLGETFRNKYDFGSAFTKWKNFPVPWSGSGLLTIKMADESIYTYYVGPGAGDDKNDYLIGTKDGQPLTPVKLGPRGRDNITCRLHLGTDKKVTFEGFVPDLPKAE